MVTAARKATAAAKKTVAKKTAPAKAPAKKAAPAPKKETAPKPPKVERDMTAYDNAVAEWRELRKDANEQFSRVSYQARRAVPSETYAKSQDEALAKLQSVVSAFREFSRLLNEVSPSA